MITFRTFALIIFACLAQSIFVQSSDPDSKPTNRQLLEQQSAAISKKTRHTIDELYFLYSYEFPAMLANLGKNGVVADSMKDSLSAEQIEGLRLKYQQEWAAYNAAQTSSSKSEIETQASITATPKADISDAGDSKSNAAGSQ